VKISPTVRPVRMPEKKQDSHKATKALNFTYAEKPLLNRYAPKFAQ